ncbi:ABCB10, partial [Symbiodinium pilosum]
VITALRRLGWSPRLRSLASANPSSDEWVAFPRSAQPTYYWNRRTGQSVWELPEEVEPAWTGYSDGDSAFFRCARTLETLWQLPPPAKMPSASPPAPCQSAEEHLRCLLEAEWVRLQGREAAIRQDMKLS